MSKGAAGDGARGAVPASAMLLLVALSLLWGFNWPIMKIGLEQIPPFVFRTCASVAAAGGLFLMARAAGLPLAVPRRERPGLLLAGILNMLLWNVLILYGVSLMDSGRAAILGYTMPLWATLIGAVVLREGLSARGLGALALGLSGVGLLLLGDERVLSGDPLGPICMLLGALSWGAGTVVLKACRFTIPVTVSTAWQHVIGLIPAVIVAALWDVHNMPPLDRIDLLPVLALLYNMLAASLFCYWAYFKVVTALPVTISTIGTLATPAIGVFAGALFLGETPVATDYAALVAVVVAVFLVLTTRR